MASFLEIIRPYVPDRMPIVGPAVVVFLLVAAFISANRNSNKVPALKDPVPYIWNAYQYMTDQQSFLRRVSDALKVHNIVGFHIGPMKFYMVKNSRSIQAMFRTSSNISPNKFLYMVFENLMNFNKQDVGKFMNDPTGRLATPTPGTEKVPGEKRYWFRYHQILHNYLARAHETNLLAVTYQRFLMEQWTRFSPGSWSEPVGIKELLYNDMFISAATAFVGPRILELNPGLIEVFWEFVDIAASLVWGLPRWLNRHALDSRRKFHGACAKYLEANFAEFDFNGPDAEADWEPIWGSRANRELCKLFRDEGFALDSQAGALAITNVFGSNANSIPIATWMVMELIQDQEALKAVREELKGTFTTDPGTGLLCLNPQKVVALPILQSVYTETLRMHMSMNVTREIIEPTQFEGYVLEKGAIIQGPSEVVHYDEKNWGSEGHSASEFWAFRHIKWVEEKGEGGEAIKVPHFTMAGRAAEFIPYGGGTSMCPGRFFAKQEMMLTTAILVSQFDIEFIEWTNLEDGTPSDRPAQNHPKFSGAAAIPPDRDMKVRLRRHT